MKAKFIDFNQLALLLHHTDLPSDTRTTVATQLSKTLAAQYPAFKPATFITTAVSGVLAKIPRTRRPLQLDTPPLLAVEAAYGGLN